MEFMCYVNRKNKKQSVTVLKLLGFCSVQDKILIGKLHQAKNDWGTEGKRYFQKFIETNVPGKKNINEEYQVPNTNSSRW